MLPLLTSKKAVYVVYFVLTITLFSLFVKWRNTIELTEQLQEKTIHLEFAYKNPKVEFREGKTKIIQGKTTIKEIIKTVYISSTTGKPVEKIEEREIITEPSITEKEGASKASEPILPEYDAKKYVMNLNYWVDGYFSIGLGLDVYKMNIGLSSKFNTNKFGQSLKDAQVGAGITFRF